ncbi:MAG: glycosyltransferase family 2 protein [Pseudomonadota bacterium]
MSSSLADTQPDLSVVIPALNEAENLPPLIGEIQAAFTGRAIEIVVVDDGSTDDTQSVIGQLSDTDPSIRLLTHSERLGRSAGMLTGVRAARAEIIVSLDGDGQNDPKYLPDLAALLERDGVGLSAGQRIKHAHSPIKRLSSKIANGVRGWILSDGTRDSGCGLKGFRRSAYLDLPYFETMHRFLPALFRGDGWDIAFVDVVDRPRLHGTSKYGVFDRLMVGLPDLYGVWWLIRRRRRRPTISDSADRTN